MHQPQHPHHMMQQQQQQQHQHQQQNTPASAAPSPLKAVTTEEIQKCLDENKNLILAILENHNQGKLAECTKYQNMLQKNLTYLAAVADAQPPPSTTPSQQPQASAAQPAISIQQTGPVQLQQQQLQQHQQQQQLQQQQQQQQQLQQQQQHHQQQQQGVQVSRLPFQLNAHPSQDPHYQLMQFQQQQQQLQGHINLGPGGANGMHQMMHPPMGAGVGSPLMDMRGTNKQPFDGGSGDVQGKSAQGGGN